MNTPSGSALLHRALLRLRTGGYSPRTESSYLYWIQRYLSFHAARPPVALGERDVESFLDHLVVRERIAAATQNVALAAILFLHREVIGSPLHGRVNALHGRRDRFIPVVLTRDELRRLFDAMSGTPRLFAELLYGTGLRLFEALQIRVQHVDFEQRRILVRQGKGRRDRMTLLPRVLVEPLRAHVARVKELHDRDLSEGNGRTLLPGAWERKAREASRDFRWQFVFPSSRVLGAATENPGVRWHLHGTVMQNALHGAAKRARIPKRVSPHVLRHTFATHVLEAGCDIRKLQALLGHASVDTTMLYTHIVDALHLNVESPLDRA